MARHREPLSGGLWTAADPGMLEPGQLSDARNLIYLRGSQAPQRAPGRAVFGVVSATATGVEGLRDVQFDNGDQYLLAVAASALKYAPVGDSGTFTTLTTLVGAPSALESAHFRNRFYLFGGMSASASSIGSNAVVYLSATATGSAPQVRQHGMLPVATAPVSASAAGTFSLTVTGYYEYWTTEVAKSTQDGAPFVMESTFVGSPLTVYVSSTGYAPLISMPPLRNPGVTTHWRIYRSPRKSLPGDKEFPSGFQIAELATATAQVMDGGAALNTGYKFPTSYNSGGNAYADGGTPSNLGADDGAVMTLATVVANGWQNPTKAQGAYGFAFGGFSGVVVGIEVEVQAHVSVGTAPATVSVHIGTRDSATGLFSNFEDIAGSGAVFGPGKNCIITSTSAGSPTTVVLGSPTDPWSDPPLTDSQFDTSFMLVLSMSQNAVRTISFDYVRVKVYYGGVTTQSATNQFPSVVYSFGDVEAQVGKNGTPPSSSTGDFYEDQLVVDDLSNRSLIRYSYPGDPDAFPETYFVDFETPQNDIVRVIRTVNDRLCVLLDNSSWRMNYLPSERDASFDRGKSKSPISQKYGCLNAMCAAVFSPGGAQDYLAFVSHRGIHATDGYNLATYTDGLNWDTILRAGSSVPIALIDDRQRQILLFYFQNTADYGSETYLCLPLSYGEGHWKNGRPKVGGLLHMRNHAGGIFASLESAWAAQRQNGTVSVYLGYGGTDTSVGAGKVYIESGTTIPALDPRMQYTTREMYLAGFGKEWEAGELYGYAFGYGSATPTLSYTTKVRKTNDTALATRETKSITLGGQKFHRAGTLHQMCEAMSITMVATASALATEFLVIEGTDFGVENAGTS